MTTRLATHKAASRITFTFRLMEPLETARHVFSPLLVRFMSGVDHTTRPVKISDSGRIRNELQTMLSQALEHDGETVRVHFDRLDERVVPREKQETIRKVLDVVPGEPPGLVRLARDRLSGLPSSSSRRAKIVSLTRQRGPRTLILLRKTWHAVCTRLPWRYPMSPRGVLFLLAAAIAGMAAARSTLPASREAGAPGVSQRQDRACHESDAGNDSDARPPFDAWSLSDAGSDCQRHDAHSHAERRQSSPAADPAFG